MDKHEKALEKAAETLEDSIIRDYKRIFKGSASATECEIWLKDTVIKIIRSYTETLERESENDS